MGSIVPGNPNANLESSGTQPFKSVAALEEDALVCGDTAFNAVNVEEGDAARKADAVVIAADAIAT